MDADEHDRVMAFLSHLPQLTVSALMEVVGDRDGPERVCGSPDGPRGHDAAGVEPGRRLARHLRIERRRHRDGNERINRTFATASRRVGAGRDRGGDLRARRALAGGVDERARVLT